MKNDKQSVWQDREIRFDISLGQLGLGKGEILVDSINSVEDTKGNNGDKGNLLITNLRLIWFDDKDQKINLSIGYFCVVNIEIKVTNSGAFKGNTQALFLRTVFNQTRFEFIFTSLIKNSPRLFTSFQAVVRSYETTKLYREFKLRAAIVQDKQLLLLEKEQVYNRYTSVWNLSAEQGNLGTFYVTNIRVVWFANLAENFNVSVPWIQINTIKVRESKFGTALVIETNASNGGYILGFKMDGIDAMYLEVTKLFKIYNKTPIFGIETRFDDQSQNIEDVTLPRTQDDVEIVEPEYQPTSSLFAYMTDHKKEDREIIHSPQLGLAIEKPPQNSSIDQLWKII